MKNRISLLVCLKHSTHREFFNELLCFRLIRPITEVKNIKLINSGGLGKAFVEVEDSVAAELVINTLHDKLTHIGDVDVLISNKKRVYYNKDIYSVLKSCINSDRWYYKACGINIKDDVIYIDNFCVFSNGKQISTKRKNLNGHNKFNPLNMSELLNRSESRDNRYNHENSFSIFEKLSFKDDLSFNVENSLMEIHSWSEQVNSMNIIHITHHELIKLDISKVSMMFGSFGTIVNLRFDYDQVYWSIKYSSLSEVQAAIKAIENNQTNGYKLCSTITQAIDDSEDDSGFIVNTQNIHGDIEILKNPSGYFLKVCFKEGKMTLDEFRSFLNTSYPTVSLKIINNDAQDEYYYSAEFEYLYKAAEALRDLSDLNKVVKWSKIEINN